MWYHLVWRGLAITSGVMDPNVYLRTSKAKWKARRRSSTLQNDTSFSYVPNMNPTWRRRRHPGKCILRCRHGEVVILRAYFPNTLCYLNGQRDKYGASDRPVNAEDNHTDVRGLGGYHRSGGPQCTSRREFPQIGPSQLHCPEYTKDPDTHMLVTVLPRYLPSLLLSFYGDLRLKRVSSNTDPQR